MEVLRAENLYKTYGTGDNAVEALKNVSFSVKRGELVAIMGPSAPNGPPVPIAIAEEIGFR